MMTDVPARVKPRPWDTMRSVRPWGRAAWGFGVLLLARIPLVVHAVPILGLLRGPLGWVLAILSLLVLLGETLRLPLPTLRPAQVFALALLYYLLLGLPYTGRIQPSGDEPHYLIMAQSLWREGDLDLRDNFAREDYREYLPGSDPLVPHYAAPRADGRPFPGHSPGLPVLLAPVYAGFHRQGCVVLMAILAALVAALAFRLAEDMTSSNAALAAWGAVVLPPLAFYSFHLYTEVPSALALSLALLLLLGPPSVSKAALAGLLACALPWLHLKMAPAALALALVAAVRLRRGWPLTAFLGVALFGAVAFGAYYDHVFGRPNPLGIYGGLPRDLSGSPVSGLLGLFLDRSFGLLPYAPVFLLAVAGLPFVLRRGEGRGGAHLLVLASVLAPVVGWRMWWGGQCPPARFLVPALPQLGVLLACRLQRGERGLVRWIPALLLLGFSLSVFVVCHPDARLLLTHGDHPSRILEALSGDVSLGRYLPSFVAGGEGESRLGLLWLAALGILLALDQAALTSERVDRLFCGLGLPVGLVLGLGVLVDSWARSGAS